jgi:hypothetical protein
MPRLQLFGIATADGSFEADGPSVFIEVVCGFTHNNAGVRLSDKPSRAWLGRGAYVAGRLAAAPKILGLVNYVTPDLGLVWGSVMH